MSRKHKLGGAKPKGFAKISLRRRTRIARMGGNAVTVHYGRTYLADLGRRGAAARYGKKEAA